MNTAQTLVPNRVRPFEKTHVPTPAWLKAILGRELSPTREEYDRVTRALWDGDKPMDDLIQWMFAADTRERKAQVQKAISLGGVGFDSCPVEIQTFFKTLEKPPEWIDFELIEEGARFIHGLGVAAGYVLRDLALMGGYMLSGFNQSLVKTGALNKGTAQRIAETAKWWIDCTEPEGLKRCGEGYKTTLQVRLVHGLVRRGLDKRDDWDHAQWGTPLSQIDMVATYLGFSVVMLVGLRKLGIPVLPRESRAVLHLWSYACWLMGVEAPWLVQSETEGFVLLNHTYMTQTPPDGSSKELALSLAEEPLERSYRHFQAWQRKLAYQQHLGMSRYFLGKNNMQRLGFENPALPWYPMISNVPRAMAYTAGRFMPGQRSRQQERGRRAQRAMMASMFGDREHDIIRPGDNHPAHL